jgi:ubiquinone biosynthesis accessory factor UbiK
MGRLHRAVPEAGAVRPPGHLCPDVCTLINMVERNPLDELRERIGEALRASPAQDLEKNLHALMAAFFDRFDLAAREDLEVHRKLLERAQAKLASLEARVAELEARKPPA